MSFRRVLVLGGARSGKSLFAERLAAECGEPVLYVATATAVDQEMAERIAHHRARRPSEWRTLEAVSGLSNQITVGELNTILVEDLTFLVSNLFLEDQSQAERRALAEVEALLGLAANVILVSNEVGMGLVPDNPLGRHFRDVLGRVNQHAAAACAEVCFIVAGLPLRLK